MQTYDWQFLIDSIALLRHERSSHMGAHQYAHHGAMRATFPMSGSLGWKRYEHDCPSYYILRCEKSLVTEAALELDHYINAGLPLIDLGTGTLEAVRSKSLPLAQAIQSEIYVPIDTSLAFCSEAGRVLKSAMPEIDIQPSIENFFAEDVEPALNRPALGFLGGITIANIEAPLSDRKPTKALIRHLKSLATIVGGGWLLLSIDTNQSEVENKKMYSENGLFEINTIDRMAYELPLNGLNPEAFIYDPVWISESSQLGHTTIALENMSIEVSAPEYHGVINIRKGDRFHLKNSFKYDDDYFISCANKAGFSHIKTWQHSERPLKLFLLKAPTIHQERQAEIPLIEKKGALQSKNILNAA